jgi:hypothetical protein
MTCSVPINSVLYYKLFKVENKLKKSASFVQPDVLTITPVFCRRGRGMELIIKFLQFTKSHAEKDCR